MFVNQLNQFSVCNSTPGLPVSKDAAEKTYLGLGEKNWWKQLYDGKYHHLGSKVFDEGLHGKEIEPGYYESALKAFHFAQKHLKEKVDVNFYCELHRIACAHFKGQSNDTEIEAKDAGRFRGKDSEGVKCKINLVEIAKSHYRNRSENDSQKNSAYEEYAFLKSVCGDKLIEKCKGFETVKEKYIDMGIQSKDPKSTISKIIEIDTHILRKIDELKKSIFQMQQDPILKNACPAVIVRDAQLFINYASPGFNDFSFDEILPHLFTSFNQSLSEIEAVLVNLDSSEQEKIKDLVQKKFVLIRDLYQRLEFLHPFPDGQGRTDLLLLSQVLAGNGFTPAILHEPYVSTYFSSDDWGEYLQEGMQEWQKEAVSGS